MSNKIPSDMVCGYIHKSKNYGDMCVVEYKSSTEVTIRFLSTGYVKTSTAGNIRKGVVKDTSVINVPFDMVKGYKHNTNYSGVLEIVEYHSSLLVTVRFLNTEAIADFIPAMVRSGTVKDKDGWKLTVPEDMSVGYLHETVNFGKVKILKYINSNSVEVMFLQTGELGNFTSSSIRSGKIKDPSKGFVKTCPDEFNVGTVHPSKDHGDIVITEYNSSIDVGIKFLRSGYHTRKHTSQIKRGILVDPTTPSISSGIELGGIYSSNSHGDFKVIYYHGYYSVGIKFIDTGWCTEATLSAIVRGSIKDKMRPTRCGVGYFGVGKYKSSVNNETTVAYRAWTDMIFRCYGDLAQKYRPTYKENSVCEEWHNFQTFAAWYEIHSFDGCQVDKDIKVTGNKIYSPETCLCVTQEENIVKAHAKWFNMVNPKGEKVEIYNMAAFCRAHNLDERRMRDVYYGNKYSESGWTKHVE